MHAATMRTHATGRQAPRAAPRRARCGVVACAVPQRDESLPRRARCGVIACAAPQRDSPLPRRAALQRAAMLALPLALPSLARAADSPSPAGDAPFVAGPQGIQYADTILGNGAEPEKGRLVKVGYVGTLTATGAPARCAAGAAHARSLTKHGRAQVKNSTRRASSASALATAR
jgi:hypothetical protein